MKEADAKKLFSAAQNGDLKILDRILDRADPKQNREAVDRALTQAVIRKHAKAAERLIAAGGNVNQTIYTGTLLSLASSEGELAMVKLLIDHGADFQRVISRETALSSALSQNRTEVIRYLEKLGAHSPPTTTLLYASMHGDLDRAKKALAEGAEIDKTGGYERETPLMAAARNGHTALVKLLLQHGAKLT